MDKKNVEMIVFGLVVLCWVGFVCVFLPLDNYHTSFEYAKGKNISGTYIVTGENINAENRTATVITKNGKKIIIKMGDISDRTPLVLAPNNVAAITLNHGHLTHIEPIKEMR